MIIKSLIKSGICFSVMKSYSSLKKTGEYRNPEYEILALMENFKELQEHGFETNQNTTECPVNWLNPDGIISKIMTGEEVAEFYKCLNHFTRVFNDPKNGIVYELKRNSFKKLYNNK